MKKVSSILLTVILVVSSLFVGDITGMNRTEKVSASSSSYKILCWSNNLTINKVTYYFEDSKNKVKKINYKRTEECPTYNICSKEGNKSTVLVKDAERTFATNGTYLYYVKYRNYRANVYRMTLKTKKSKKIFTAPKKTSYYLCRLDAVKGKYVYYTTIPGNGDYGYHNYVYNTKTKKNKQIEKDKELEVWGNQLVFGEVRTEYANGNIYFAKLDGTKKKKIASGIDYFAYNKKFYWWEQNEKEPNQYRLGCCNKKGKAKKYLSPWTDNIDYGTQGEKYPYLTSTKKIKKDFIKQFKVRSGCSYKQSKKVYKETLKTNSNDFIKIDRGIVSYEYPQFSGKSKAIKKVNADIRKQCKAFMNSSDAKLLKKSVKTAIKKNEFTHFDDYYYYEAECEITYKKKNIVSILISSRWNVGGPYIDYGWANLTYNTKTGKRLTYKNVISGNAKKKVVKACKKYFKDYWNYDGIIASIRKKKNYEFYLKDGKAYICFGRGEVAAVYAGTPQVPVASKYK